MATEETTNLLDAMPVVNCKPAPTHSSRTLADGATPLLEDDEKVVDLGRVFPVPMAEYGQSLVLGMLRGPSLP